MNRKSNRLTAWMLTVVFTLSLLPLSLAAANNSAPVTTDNVIDSGTATSTTGQASITGGAVNPNSYPYGSYPYGTQPAFGSSTTSKVPMLIGAAFGGLLGAHFGIVGTLAGATVGGLVGKYIGGQMCEPAYGNYYDNYNNRLDRYYSDYYSNLGQRTSNMGILPGIAGGVFGALIGSSFGGALGAVVGGVAGYFVGQVFAQILFPQEYYANYNYGGNSPFDSFRTVPTPFQQPTTTNGYGFQTTVPTGSVNEGYYTQYMRKGAPAAPTSTSLEEARASFYGAVSAYEATLKSGTQEQKLQARQVFETARDAYFSLKGPKNP